jgi:pilus assembly protein CpaF
LPLEAIRQQIASALDIIIHLSRLRDKSRKTVEIVEVLNYDSEKRRIIINPLYEFIEDEKTSQRKVSGSLTRTGNAMVNTDKLIGAGVSRVI